MRDEKRTDRAENAESGKGESDGVGEESARSGEAVDGDAQVEGGEAAGADASFVLEADESRKATNAAPGASAESASASAALRDSAGGRGVAGGVEHQAHAHFDTDGSVETQRSVAEAGRVRGTISADSEAAVQAPFGFKAGVEKSSGRDSQEGIQGNSGASVKATAQSSRVDGLNGTPQGPTPSENEDAPVDRSAALPTDSTSKESADSQTHVKTARPIEQASRAEVKPVPNTRTHAQESESRGDTRQVGLARGAGELKDTAQARPVVNAQELQAKSDWSFRGASGGSSLTEPASAQSSGERSPHGSSGLAQRTDAGAAPAAGTLQTGAASHDDAQQIGGLAQQGFSESASQQKEGGSSFRRGESDVGAGVDATREPVAGDVAAGLTRRRGLAGNETIAAPDRGSKVPPAGHEGNTSGSERAVGAGSGHGRAVSVVMGRTGEPALETFAGTAQRAGGRMATTEAQFERVLAAQVERGVISAMKAQNGQVTIRLHPASLGQMRVYVKMEQGGVNAKFEASSSRAKELIAKGVSGLRESLGERGIELHRVVVSIGDDHTPNGESESFSQEFKNSPEPASVGTRVASAGVRSARSAQREFTSRVSPGAMLEALRAQARAGVNAAV